MPEVEGRQTVQIWTLLPSSGRQSVNFYTNLNCEIVGVDCRMRERVMKVCFCVSYWCHKLIVIQWPRYIIITLDSGLEAGHSVTQSVAPSLQFSWQPRCSKLPSKFSNPPGCYFENAPHHRKLLVVRLLHYEHRCIPNVRYVLLPVH